MSNIQEELLGLLKEKATIDDLSNWFGLSQKQIYQRILKLKNKGYNILRKDFASGKVQFELTNKIIDDGDEKILYTFPNTDTLRVIISSDTHLGNIKQNIEALNAGYDYAVQNDIHAIIGCGDMLDGFFPSKFKFSVYNSYDEQFQKALKVYPFDPSIINYNVLGNHDEDYLNNNYVDIRNAILNRRYDIFPISYKNASIKIKNDEIKLFHPSEQCNYKLENSIVFRGHSHKAKFVDSENSNQKGTYVYVPTLSNMHNGVPSMYDVVFVFNKVGVIKEINISTLVFVNGNFIKVNEYLHKIFPKLLNNNDVIENEETPKVLKKQMNG